MFGKNNYYEILGIDINASQAEIKKAYFAAVRKYPPERFEHEFKEIREAYDTLSDVTGRAEYDAIVRSAESAERAEKHFELGKAAYGDDDYDKAIEQLEIASRLAPEVGFIRNLLGLSYMESEEYKKAAEVFKKLTYDYPGKASYHTNLGYALYRKGANKQAKKAYEAALKLDNTNFDAWMGLSDVYYELNDMARSRSVLLEAIKHCGENLSFYMEMVKVDINDKNMENLRADVDNLTEVAKKDEDMRGNVAWALAKIAMDMMDSRMPDYAARIIEKAHELDPDEKYIKSIYDDAASAEKLLEPLKRLRQEKNIHPALVEYLELQVYKDRKETSFHNFDSWYEEIMLDQPGVFISSINFIKENYPELYKLKKTFLNKVLKSPPGVKIDAKKADDSDGDKELDYYIPGPTIVKDKKVGRNDPCPCGSGKKYKKCCIDKE